jgi:hypothetical protein
MSPYQSAARGTAFGFEVRSSLPLRHLRNGEGVPLEVAAGDTGERPDRADKLLIEWKPPENNYSGRLYYNGERYLLWIAGSGWFTICPTTSQITVPKHKDLAKIEERLWGIPALLCFTARGDHALHAAAVEVNGAGVLIAGSQRLGRSAITASFATAGHRVLTQELACLRMGPTTGIVPGPSMLRVPKNQLDSIDMSSGNGNWIEEGDHYSLDATRRGTSKPIPVRSVILLRATDESPSLEPLEPAQAISDLWSLSFRLPTEDDRARCFDGVADLAGNVPVFKLHMVKGEDPLSLVDRIRSSSLEYA